VVEKNSVRDVTDARLGPESLRDGRNVLLAGCLQGQVDRGPGGGHLYQVHTDHDPSGGCHRLGQARQ
jgi:hypothetical protein